MPKRYTQIIFLLVSLLLIAKLHAADLQEKPERHPSHLFTLRIEGSHERVQNFFDGMANSIERTAKLIKRVVKEKSISITYSLVSQLSPEKVSSKHAEKSTFKPASSSTDSHDATPVLTLNLREEASSKQNNNTSLTGKSSSQSSSNLSNFIITANYQEGTYVQPLQKISFSRLEKIIVLPPQAIYILDSSLFGNDLDPPELLLFGDGCTLKLANNSSITTAAQHFAGHVNNKTLFLSASENICKNMLAVVKNPNIFLLLDDAYMAEQLSHLDISKAQQSAKYFFAMLHGFGFSQINQLIGTGTSEEEISTSFAASSQVTYTGMDNVLFERAYIHMINILRKAYHPEVPATNFNTSPETIRWLFYTKRHYLLAMIAFLNGCYDVTASEDKASEDELATQLTTSSANQAKTQTTEIEEDTKFHPQETEEDLDFFRKQLDYLDVLELYREIGGDLTKIPREKSVLALRIKDASLSYLYYLSNKYDDK